MCVISVQRHRAFMSDVLPKIKGSVQQDETQSGAKPDLPHDPHDKGLNGGQHQCIRCVFLYICVCVYVREVSVQPPIE